MHGNGTDAGRAAAAIAEEIPVRLTAGDRPPPNCGKIKKELPHATPLRADLRWPSRAGAVEVMRRLGEDATEGDFECEDFEYTAADADRFGEYLDLLTAGDLSDAGKRVLGAFLFETLEELWGTLPHAARRLTLEALWQDRAIHGHEFRYWAGLDRPDHDDPAHWWEVQRFLRLDGPFDLSRLRPPR